MAGRATVRRGSGPLHEVPPGGQHHEVDGVEVLFAAEAAAQIGAWVDGRQGLAATGADEHEATVPAFAGPVQLLGEANLSTWQSADC